MVDCGTYEELQTRGIDFAALLKEYEDEERKSEKLSRSQSIISRESEGASPEDVAFNDVRTDFNFLNIPLLLL